MMINRPDWEDDDDAGAGQDLFATALIAMILITAAFLMEVGQRKVKAPEQLPESVLQEWRLIHNSQIFTMKFATELCITSNNFEWEYPIDAYTPFGYMRLEPPQGNPEKTALQLSSKPTWVESCE
ncbi:hypothetical protein M0C34_15980 [Agarivorans sp. TSD2052]|uniref:hypothetical protein n=1 Tax=Agarivorans sp. TSD2052 TaxID=2937286 RepID=UPI00200E6AFB|nr:hypothetical protein [Agarivorans sp. TSD2052]UPW17727.1 hypothetical protein M0C34_15980 [Agarivorans sp. TSD2052]